MEIYFEDGQAVSKEIRKTMERAVCRCLETEGVDGQRAQMRCRSRENSAWAMW